MSPDGVSGAAQALKPVDKGSHVMDSPGQDKVTATTAPDAAAADER
jgi:hypothetical protein